MIVFLNGQFLHKEDAAISVDDRGFLFSDGAYEVVRSYRGRLFQLEAHRQRLLRGLSELRIPCEGMPDLAEVSLRLLQDNDLSGSEAVIYYQVTRGAPPVRAHAFPAPGVLPTVYITASAFKPALEKRQLGIAAITVADTRWSRCDLKTIGLLANCLAKQQAYENGADEAIFVRDGVALEGSSSNLFVVEDGCVITNRRTNFILPGITRNIVIECCREGSLALDEVPIRLDLLKSAEEIFVTHTSGEVVPIINLDGRMVGNGRPGAVTRRLQTAFTKFVAETS